MQTKIFTLLLSIVVCEALNAQLTPSWEYNGIYYETMRDTIVTGQPFPGHIVKVSTMYENDSPNGTMGSARMVFGVYSGDIVIPPEFVISNAHYYVEGIGSCAFQYCGMLTSITLPNSIKWIGQNAFNGCHNLKTLDIPNSVDSIATTAFNSCIYLVSVSIGKNLRTIADDAFYRCNRLTNVYWNAFECWKVSKLLFPTTLKSITFGADVAVIPAGICAGKSELSKVTISDNVTVIGEQAFYGCGKLTEVQFPSTLNQIDSKAFANTGLWCVTIPEPVYSIEEDAFEGCLISDVYWDSRSTGEGVCNVDFRPTVQRITFGDKVEMIPSLVCKNQTHLEEVFIPASVKTIRESAFEGCTNLRRLYLGPNVKKIGSKAFYGCSSLASALVLPDNLDTIGSSAFYECSMLPSITLGMNLQSIGNNAFYGCTNLKTVYNFSSLTIVKTASTNGFVGKYADIVYNNLEKCGDYIFLPNNNGTIKGALVGYTGYSTDLTLPADYKGGNYRIGNNAFQGASQISSITLSESIVEIGEYAFHMCSGLTNISIPISVTEIGQNAFRKCSNITEITLGARLSRIGANAFAECTSIQEIQSLSQTPPLAYANTFTNVPSTATVYVPGGSRIAYQVAQGWSQFNNIVETDLIPVTGVTINPTSLTLGKGEEALLYAIISPSNASYQTVEWSSSDNNIATVSNGLVHGKNGGVASVTCTTTDGGYSATCEVTVVTNPIPATGLEIYKGAYLNGERIVPYSIMNEGDTLTFIELGTGFLTVNVIPASVSNGNIVFSVSNPSVLSAELTSHINFTNRIRLTPIHSGTTKITFSTTDGTNISQSVYVTITPDPTIKVLGVRILKKELTLAAKETDTLSVQILPSNATNTDVDWTSSDLTLASVLKVPGTNRGVVTAKNLGKTGPVNIICTTKDGNYSDTCVVTIIKQRVSVTALGLNYTSKTLNIGETLQLKPVFTPTNATNQKVYWSMDNDTVATLQNGLVTAIHAGRVTVTCVSEDGGYKAQCVITISDEVPHEEGITVRLKVATTKGWSTVYLWAWTDKGNIFASWPGQKLNKDANGWYGYTFDASIKSINIIWNDGTNQTEDITNITSSTCYQMEDAYYSIVDCDSMLGIEDIYMNSSSVTKILRNGQIFIFRGEKVYTVMGQDVQ